jgi:hypothetical protein
LLSACSQHAHLLSGGAAFTGKVVNGETGHAISGATVIAEWRTDSLWSPEADNSEPVDPALMTRSCLHVETATTDENGVYAFPRWWSSSSYLRIGGEKFPFSVFAFKAGYVSPQPVVTEPVPVYTLIPAKQAKAERLEYLAEISRRIRCSSYNSNDSVPQLPVLRALYDEAIGIEQTEEDRQAAEFILWMMETIEMPQDALERHQSRTQADR